jgi:hypothetical protein
MVMAKSNAATVRQAIGVFSNAQQLQSAIDELQEAGFERSQLGILASEVVVEQQLSNIYQRTSDSAEPAAAPASGLGAQSGTEPEPKKMPAIAFVSRDSIGESGEVMSGSLYFIGSSGLAGALVASAAVLGGGLTAAVGGILGVGLVGLAVGAMINQSDADELQQRVDEGHILLFVRLPQGAREQLAKDILARHNATDVKVHVVPIKDSEPVAAD